MKEIKLIVTDLDGTFLSHSETDGSLEKISVLWKRHGRPAFRYFLARAGHGCKAPPR